MRYSFPAMIGLAAAAQTPGGAIPAGLKEPNVSGFMEPTVQPSRGGGAICVSGIVGVQASTTKNIKLNYQLPANQSQVTQTFLDLFTQGSPFMSQIMGGMNNVSGTYNISATLCMPGDAALNMTTVQFLTHGVGFDKYYWDFAPGYSYIDVAAANGYATFSYDRLGVGDSSKPDAIQVVQSPLEVEIAHNLIQMLRSGHFGGAKFMHVVGTGHSFGSIITQAVTAQYATALDAAVLTGFSTNATALPTFISALNLAIATQNQPYRFGDLSNGYLVAATDISTQIGFFRAPGFDPAILALADATKGTVTIGELLTQMAATAVAANFTGPVAVVNGAEDLPFCFGNCSYPADKAAMIKRMLYPAASNLSTTYLVPVMGHGVNLHYSATEAFEFIQDFVNSVGL